MGHTMRRMNLLAAIAVMGIASTLAMTSAALADDAKDLTFSQASKGKADSIFHFKTPTIVVGSGGKAPEASKAAVDAAPLPAPTAKPLDQPPVPATAPAVVAVQKAVIPAPVQAVVQAAPPSPPSQASNPPPASVAAAVPALAAVIDGPNPKLGEGGGASAPGSGSAAGGAEKSGVGQEVAVAAAPPAGGAAGGISEESFRQSQPSGPGVWGGAIFAVAGVCCGAGVGAGGLWWWMRRQGMARGARAAASNAAGVATKATAELPPWMVGGSATAVAVPRGAGAAQGPTWMTSPRYRAALAEACRPAMAAAG